MPLTIKTLRCRVRVRTGGGAETPLHQEEAPERPALLYALPNAPVALETGAEPGRTASAAQERERNAPGATRTRANPKTADPRLVADRVFDLFAEEARRQRERGR